MEINLNLASLQDLDLILPFVSAYHAFERLESTASERASTIRKLLLNSDFGGIWLIYCNNELAGYIALCRGYSIEFQGFEAFIDEFFLSAEFRGKGIGTQVLEAIKKEASKLNVKVLHLEVARDNKTAQKLYVKAGFQTREKYILMSKEL
ncbi:MAG: GNAT family N-acetyltransferase [Gammaproteobacteria bacterium]|nr:GNAT family N-acetyltransferase [Gammaproteobacteria bacterium]